VDVTATVAARALKVDVAIVVKDAATAVKALRAPKRRPLWLLLRNSAPRAPAARLCRR